VTGPVTVQLPAELLEQVAQRAAELIAERDGTAQDAWLTVAEAAQCLRCTSSRIYSLVSARRIPFHKDGSRVLMRRSELDAWVRQGGGRCPS